MPVRAAIIDPRMESVFELSELREPIVQAPMAGGPSTPELAIAVCRAGGLGFLAAGYRRPEDVREQIVAVRATVGGAPFGVNLFVPGERAAVDTSMDAYLRELEREAAVQEVGLGDARHSDDEWQAKLDVVVAERPPVVSFAFGCPSIETVVRLHDVGVSAWVTVTSADEAEQAVSVGADGLVVQGTEAGGHRGGFTDDEGASGSGLIALLRVIARAVAVPLVASGGIADGAAVAAVLCAGASAAQIGTALMLAPESGTAPAQRAILGTRAPTRLTRAFSGRQARGIVNRFMREHDATAPAAYPEINYATAPLRAAARRRGDADAFNLWAGQAHELAQERPAGEIVREMGAEARRVVRELADRL